VLDAKFGAGNDISKKFNKFDIGLAKQHPCQRYRFSKNFLTCTSSITSISGLANNLGCHLQGKGKI
jgi:hypothetical protein